MIRQPDRTRAAEGSDLARAIGLIETESGPHPRTTEILRRDRAKGETRRLTEFLRIERGRLA